MLMKLTPSLYRFKIQREKSIFFIMVLKNASLFEVGFYRAKLN